MNGATGALPLDWGDLAIAAALVGVAGLVSVLLGLGLLPRLALASVRTIAQLTLLGYVLEWIFALDSAPLVLGFVGLMTAAAGHAAVGRSERVFRGVLWRSVLTLVVTGVATTLAVTQAVIGVAPWYEPQYVIPLLGMVLGNSLTGISLCLDTLLEDLSDGRDEVELRLTLGATRWEAGRPPMTRAVRRGMVPIINAMMVVGIVSLPGMMTGQILQGADPLLAIRYQIVVMFMLAASVALGCMLVAWLAWAHLFNDRHQLRSERIRRRG